MDFEDITQTNYIIKTPHLRGVEDDCEHLRNNFWCPRAESNHGLMITNQLHDLHATGARAMGGNYSLIISFAT